MKRILCFGDSNTHGYCADPSDCMEGGGRFNEEERWTRRLQTALGESYLIIEEGLSGRTTVFPDPLQVGAMGGDYLIPCIQSHQPIDLLVIMLGTNDTKERLSANAPCIGLGMRRLVEMARTQGVTNFLLIAPPPIREEIYGSGVKGTMGAGCVEKSQQLAAVYEKIAQELGVHFWDAGSLGQVFNSVDYMHLTAQGHKKMAEVLTDLLPALV